MNPVRHLLAANGALSALPAAAQRTVTGKQFFPELISAPFHQGLVVVFAGAAGLAALAALASLLRGGRPMTGAQWRGVWFTGPATPAPPRRPRRSRTG